MNTTPGTIAKSQMSFPTHPSQLQPPIPTPEPQPAPAPAKRRRKLTIAKQEPGDVAGKTPPTSH